MQEHLLTRDSAIAYLLDNEGIKNIAGTTCGNTYTTKGRSGYKSDNACPDQIIPRISADPSAPDYRWDGCKSVERGKTLKFASISRDSFFENSLVPTNVLLMPVSKFLRAEPRMSA